jgi:hypothetical protein
MDVPQGKEGLAMRELAWEHAVRHVRKAGFV